MPVSYWLAEQQPISYWLAFAHAQKVKKMAAFFVLVPE